MNNRSVPAEVSTGFVPWMIRHQISLVCSACRSGRLLFLGSRSDGKPLFTAVQFPGAMGVMGGSQRIFLATERSIMRLENTLRADEMAEDRFDRLFVPRVAQITGNVLAHEVVVAPTGHVVFVNTRYSCLAAASISHAFKPLWKPPFVSKLVPEDRCHLNGLAMADGRVRYVTAFSTTDVVDGWREHRGSGGVLIDVANDRIVAEGFSMPHSPRVHDGFVWLDDSGSGHLCRVDPRSGRRENVAFCPGLPRGIAFVGDYAVVTLSLPRHERFQGLALEDELARRKISAWCGVVVIDLRDGSIAEWARLGEEFELFDVEAIRARAPTAIAPGSSDLQDAITFEDFAPRVQPAAQVPAEAA